ncbi:MAG: hypothetical protein EA350_16435 [Gemmatimonadales bacterium]|nr:MAG: hypothetical protein EA350_16435 [Gemmatimonadales bacterium]
MTSTPLSAPRTRLLGGMILGALLLVGCIASPTFPTPESGDDPNDQPDAGGPSAFHAPPPGLFFLA